MTWFHTTTPANLEKILREGLKINSGPNYSQGSLDYMNSIYGMIPVFLSKLNQPYDKDESSIVLEININGLEDKLAADIPTLAQSYGAYLDEERGAIWFEEGNDRTPDEFKEDEEIYYEDLLYSWAKEPSINLTQTAAFLGNIPANRIRLATKDSGATNQSTIFSALRNSDLLLEKKMLKDLVKVANKLDSVGLTKEADFIDMQILALASEFDNEIMPDDLSDEDVVESTEPLYNNPGKTSPEERLLRMLMASDEVLDNFPGKSPDEVGLALGVSDDPEVMKVLESLMGPNSPYTKGGGYDA